MFYKLFLVRLFMLMSIKIFELLAMKNCLCIALSFTLYEGNGLGVRLGVKPKS
jgi:hypothetical protein